MHPKSQPPTQIFVQFPEFQTPTRTLTLNLTSQTLHHLKLSLFPNTLPLQSLSSLYFTLNGKPLSDSTLILDPQIAPLSTLILRTRALGGGGDGGATGAESRDCYLKMYAEKKPDKVDLNEQRLSKWLNCALSYEPLREPCVVDWLGNIFNKESLVEALLGKNLPKEFGHIKGLKDMIKVHLFAIPGIESGRGSLDGARFQCPISGLEFNGKYRFFALRTCGHVLSAKALKEVKSSCCLVCHVQFKESDKIVINGSDQEVMVLRERMEEGKAKVREKKMKKAVKNGGEEEGLELSRVSGTKHGIEVEGSMEKVSLKVEVNGKGSNGVGPVKGVKRFKATDIAPAHATKEIYASIFTSSRKSDFKETYSCRSLPLGRN